MKKHMQTDRGVTIIDMMMAIAMTAIVVGIVFTMWANISRHVSVQRHKSFLNFEIRQLVKGMTTQIRRSPAVLAWHSTGITFVSPDSADTIVYEFYADELLRNDTPITLQAQAAYLSDFSVSETELSTDRQSDTHLLTISISLQDNFLNSVTVSANVAARVTSETEGTEELSKWNF